MIDMRFRSQPIGLKALLLCTTLTLGLLFSSLGLAVLPGSLESLMALEKNVNRTVNPARLFPLKNTQQVEYTPEAGQQFAVASFWLDAEMVTTFQAQSELPAFFFRQHAGKKQVLFLVHPESTEFYKEFVRGAESGPSFKALATSSSRTLLVHPENDPNNLFFAKLSLERSIGGVMRTIHRGEISSSIGTTQILQSSKDYLPSSFGYFPEVLGVQPQGMIRGGFIIREIPKEIIEGKVTLMPMFSLSIVQPGEKISPLQQMIQKTGEKPQEFIRNRIIKPFVTQWLELAVQHGIVTPSHGQNFLMEVAHGLPTGRFYFRDFGGFKIDLAYRAAKKLPMPEQLPVFGVVSREYHQGHLDEAIHDGLYNYFEGGVLYSMAADLAKLAPGIYAHRLSRLLRKELAEQAQKYGIKFSVSDVKYKSLPKEIARARKKVLVNPHCSRSLEELTL